MRRCTLAVAGLVWLALAGAAAGQGIDDAVRLRYHFQPGQQFRYRMTVSGDLGTTLSGVTGSAGTAQPGKIPATMSGTYEWVQNVKSVSPEGLATVSFGLNRMELTTGSMGINFSMRMGAGGKLEMLMNGQPMAPPHGANTTIPNPFYVGRIDPTGKLTVVSADPSLSMSQLFGGQNIASMFNGRMPGMGMLALPEKPIKPGDTWDTKTDILVPISVPWLAGAGAGGSPAGAHLRMSASIHNRLLRVEAGRAVIETQVAAAAPDSTKVSLPTGSGAPLGISLSFEKMEQSTTGTQRLSIEQGEIEDGDYVLTTAMVMTMGLPPGTKVMTMGAPPGTGPNAAPGTTKQSTPRKASARSSAMRKKPNRSTHRAGTAATHASAAPSGLRIGVEGTMKLKIERLAPADAPPAPPAEQ